MPDTLIAALIVAGLYAYVAAGRAYFDRLNKHDMLVHPELAESCEFRTSLAAGHIGARFTRGTFILSWPLWLALGFVLACFQKNG